MISSPRVTVVTPAFNAATTIADTIASVRAQTCQDWEMIVVDDGSPDATVDVAVAAAGGDDRIRCLSIPNSRTAAAPRNRAIQEARGRVIAFLDADDMWLPEYLSKQVRLLDETGAMLVHCAWRNLVDGTVSDEPSHCPPGMLEGEALVSLLVKQHVMSCCATVVHADALKNGCLFDPDPRLRGPEDFDLWLRLAVRGPFFHNPERLLIVRVRPDSISHNLIGNTTGTILALQRFRAREPQLASMVSHEWHCRMSEMLTALGSYKLRNALDGNGREELARVLRHAPLRPGSWLWAALALAGPGAARTWTNLRHRPAGPGELPQY